MAAGGNFFDEFRSDRRDEHEHERKNEQQHNSNHNQKNLDESANANANANPNNPNNANTRFVTGDNLHKLRHQVLEMRLELREARSRNDLGRIRDLERAIVRTQQVDAEFVYTVSLERRELALREGNVLEAERFQQTARIARSSLPQFQLEGLWVGKYGEDQGYEMINVTYVGDVLVAHKVTSGTKHVPRGQETFRVDLSPQTLAVENVGGGFGGGGGIGGLGSRQRNHHYPHHYRHRHRHGNMDNDYSDHWEGQQDLSPIELGESASKQWGCKYLQRFAGRGQVASEGYVDSQWMQGQLILVNEYFSFAWVPIGHQVFFGRPTPELVLKLIRDESKKETTAATTTKTKTEVNSNYDTDSPSSSSSSSSSSPARSFLEKCWEETEHIQDDLEADEEFRTWKSSSSNAYYDQKGCFE
eukprot:CAMPEP_0172397160 /NCGR_PEP_ID=MMETSP1061-20121228/29314_1 /TAXON_ID=37318 /ORGANISM="Pseudo-nitzschia pungens, Strain cf. pungens" /LENGTH=415 /DNA_ID=CAMNT_0013129247 /DNA_START=1071 /DNA_END=2318 /DNA_ORIENTATION=-